MCAVHSFYKLHAQLSKLMQNYECTFFVVTPFFTAARHGSVCVLLEGKQNASTASFLFLRDKVTNWLTGFLSLQKIHCLFWMRRINHVGKKEISIWWNEAMSSFDREQSGTTYISQLSMLITLSVCDQRIYNPSESKGELPKTWSEFKSQVFSTGILDTEVKYF